MFRCVRGLEVSVTGVVDVLLCQMYSFLLYYPFNSVHEHPLDTCTLQSFVLVQCLRYFAPEVKTNKMSLYSLKLDLWACIVVVVFSSFTLSTH